MATATLVAGACSLVNAQTTGIQVGLKVGLNLSVLDGQINRSANFKPGLLVGGFVRWRPTERVAIQPELVYSQQGVTNTATYLGNKATSHIYLNYKNDFAVCGGLGIDLPSGLLASVRLNYGVSNIDNDSKSMATREALGLGDLHNRTSEFSVG